MWWRSLIPVWRFFDQVGEAPRLWVRTNEAWRPVPRAYRGPWWTLFYNPAGNLAHAHDELYARCLSEAQSCARVEALVSYRLVEHLARTELRREGLTAIGDRFQFKLTDATEDALIGTWGSL